MSAAETAREILGFINEQTSDLTFEEKLMVLGYIAEHCKARVQTVLAYEYHRALYEPKESE